MYEDRLAEYGGSKLSARNHVGALLDIKPATLRNWVEMDMSVAAAHGSKTVADHDVELAALRKENAELRRANEILKTASAFLAAAESTTDCGDRRLFRRSQRPVRRSFHLPRVHRARNADRPVHVLRP